MVCQLLYQILRDLDGGKNVIKVLFFYLVN